MFNVYNDGNGVVGNKYTRTQNKNWQIVCRICNAMEYKKGIEEKWGKICSKPFSICVETNSRNRKNNTQKT